MKDVHLKKKKNNFKKYSYRKHFTKSNDFRKWENSSILDSICYNSKTHWNLEIVLAASFCFIRWGYQKNLGKYFIFVKIDLFLSLVHVTFYRIIYSEETSARGSWIYLKSSANVTIITILPYRVLQLKWQLYQIFFFCVTIITCLSHTIKFCYIHLPLIWTSLITIRLCALWCWKVLFFCIDFVASKKDLSIPFSSSCIETKLCTWSNLPGAGDLFSLGEFVKGNSLEKRRVNTLEKEWKKVKSILLHV